MKRIGLVSCEVLQSKIGQIKIIDASLHLDKARRPLQEFIDKRIPTSQFFDIDLIASPSPLPHMFPTMEIFKDKVEEMGITEKDEIIFYDTAGIFSSPRAYFTFKMFGAKNIKILNGGLPQWIKEGRELESGERKQEQKSIFQVNYNPQVIWMMLYLLFKYSTKANLEIDE